MSKALASFSAPLLLGTCLGFLSASSAQAQAGQANPTVIREVKHDVSPPLRSLGPSFQASAAADRLALVARPTGPAGTNSLLDPSALPSSVPHRRGTYELLQPDSIP